MQRLFRHKVSFLLQFMQLFFMNSVSFFMVEKRLLQLQNRVSAKIQAVMEKKGLNQQNLADKMKRNKGYISRIINCDANLTLQKIAEIEEALGVRILKVEP